jgi:hypothetical protein
MTTLSKSWIDLEPLRTDSGNIECFDDYYNRIKLKKEYLHIPEIVFKQWLWAHHDKYQSIMNYGWMNYMCMEFTLCRWSNALLSEIYVIEDYREYYENRASYTDIKSFCCIDQDVQEWIKHGTWRTPPIIFDVTSIKGSIPNWCELVPPFQLVEGHSRLGYLHSMFTLDKLGKEKVAEEHYVYLMREKCTNA